jgi:hypothetical protein
MRRIVEFLCRRGRLRGGGGGGIGEVRCWRERLIRYGDVRF